MGRAKLLLSLGPGSVRGSAGASPSLIKHALSEEPMESRVDHGDVATRGKRSTQPDLSNKSGASDPPTGANPSSLTAWERISFAITYALASGLLACLSLRGFHRFGQWFGTIEWLLNYKRRRRFIKALRSVLGCDPTAAQRRRWGREFFINQRCDRLFYLIFDRIPREQALKLFTIGNQALLDEALSRGRGVYIALSHHGAHHVAGMLMALRGYKVAGVRDRREGRMRRYIQDRFDRRYPEFRRVRMLFADSFPRDIYRCFQDGFVLGSAMDVGRVRDPRQKTQTVTIFGARRPFVTGPLRIALRCRAPVLQGFIIPGSGFRYRLELIDLVSDLGGAGSDSGGAGDEEAIVATTLATYAATVERQVRAIPSLISRI